MAEYNSIKMDKLNTSKFELPPLYHYSHQHVLYAYGIAILFATLISILVTKIKVPQQLMAYISGFVLGLIAKQIGYFEMITYNPDLLLSIYMPVVLIKVGYSLDSYILLKSLSQILLMTLIGNLCVIIFLAFMIYYIRVGLIFQQTLLITIIVTPNECPEMPNLDAIKNLEMLMYGEALFGLSLSMTLFLIVTGILRGHINKWYHCVSIIIRYIGLSIPFGTIFGKLSALVFAKLYYDPINSVAVIVAANFLIYNICELMLYCNGIIATFINIYYMTSRRTKLLTLTDRNIKLTIDVAYNFVQTALTVYTIAQIVYKNVFTTFVLVFGESISVYIIATVLRFIVLLLESPLLSRIGYGFNFNSLVTMFWVVYKGPIQTLAIMNLMQNHSDLVITNLAIQYTLYYVFLVSLLNAPTINAFLKRFGMMKLSNRKKGNVSMSIDTMNETANNILAMVKMNRFYSDANWAIIRTQTTLINPFEEFNLGLKSNETIVCPVCENIVYLQPTKVEYENQLKDVALRVLKAQRVSFIRQHEMGYLSKMDVEHLLESVERAMDSPDLNINIEYLYKSINEKTLKRLKKIVSWISIEACITIPKQKFARGCFYIAHSLYFELFIHIIVLLDMILKDFIYEVTIFCLLVYFVEACIKFYSLEEEDFSSNLNQYLKNFWNQMDMLVISVDVISIILTVLVLNGTKTTGLLKVVIVIKMFLIIKLCRFYVKMFPHIIAYIEKRYEIKIMRVFVISMALVISCEEVIIMLPSLSDRSNVRAVIKKNLLTIHAETTQQIGNIEKQRPALTTTIKTVTALRCIYKHLRECVSDLRSSGFLDAFEYNKLSYVVHSKGKHLEKIKIMEVIQPKMIFNDIYWLSDNNYITEYIYENVKTKIYNPGDIVCAKGETPDGVYIIVTGYFKVTYYPNEGQLKRLELHGELPNKEFVEYMRFDEMQEDFLSCANRMGELSVITKRAYNCSIVAEAPSQAFIIPRSILRNAMRLNPDPVYGLAAKIWKSTLLALGRRLLLNTSAYQSATTEQVNSSLNRAIIPNTDYYSTIILTPAVEDVILLDGTVMDFNTRDVFIAPCVLPRQVTKIIMSKDSRGRKNRGTKLMFVPAGNTDEYEMMVEVEKNSDLIIGHECTMLSAESHKSNNSNKLMKYHTNIRKTSGAPYYTNKMLPTGVSINYLSDRNVKSFKTYADDDGSLD